MSFADNVTAKSSSVKITPSDIDARLSTILLTVPGVAKGSAKAKIAAIIITGNKHSLRKVITLITDITG